MKLNPYRIAVLLVLIATAGLSAQQHSPQHGASVIPDNSWPQLMASMSQMHSTIGSMESSGNSDSDFARLMLPHHQAAIDMARTQLLYGKDPQMRRLAQEIITDQQSEIELMQLWLKQHHAQK